MENVITYELLNRRYIKLSCENTNRARKVDTEEGYRKAQEREQLIRRAFFADVKKYLNSDLKPLPHPVTFGIRKSVGFR